MGRILLQIYTKECGTSYEFYKEAFGAEYGYQEKTESGEVIHQELDVCGMQIAVGQIPAGAEAVTGNTMQLCLQLDPTEKERVKHAYERLQEGGRIITPPKDLFFSEYGFEVVDRYGVWWCVFV